MCLGNKPDVCYGWGMGAQMPFSQVDHQPASLLQSVPQFVLTSICAACLGQPSHGVGDPLWPGAHSPAWAEILEAAWVLPTHRRH